jgi:hypothetical protein
VQPFLPFTDFEETAQSLETRRLGKRRVETLQIVRAPTRPGYARRNHPAIRMWREYEEAAHSGLDRFFREPTWL